VDLVILGHVHEDHMAGLHRLPHAPVQVHEAYLAAALRAYKKGERTHPSMRAIAASLSEEDILDLAAYYSQQR
jgi:cytochrome c553